MKSKIVAIIQARMGSTRLPGKVLKEVQGVPLLGIMMSRVERSEMLNEIVIATSSLPIDDQIEEFCQEKGYECFRGSENDVLSRYFHCATQYHADVIVRLTGDCPLIDPEIIDNVIHFYTEQDVDYASNTVPPQTGTFPDGSDVEVFSMKALTKAHNKAKDLKDLEHVTFIFWKSDNGFSTAQYHNDANWSDYRITVDYPEDFIVIEYLVRTINLRQVFGKLAELISLIDENPSIKDINSLYSFGQKW
jgi:spore coat polysaccharide biosynthesis protein SpsF